MKKTVSFVCGALLAVALVACGGSAKTDSTMPKQTGDSTMTPAPSGDQTATPPADPNHPAPDPNAQPQPQPPK